MNKTTLTCGVLSVTVFLAVGLQGLTLMLLWNWIAVGLVAAPVIDFWQGVGLSLLLSFVAAYFRRTSK